MQVLLLVRLDACYDQISNFIHLIGSTGNDTILGNNQNNTLDGNAGDDVLDGVSGNNTLIAGAGTDTLVARTGEDLYDDMVLALVYCLTLRPFVIQKIKLCFGGLLVNMRQKQLQKTQHILIT